MKGVVKVQQQGWQPVQDNVIRRIYFCYNFFQRLYQCKEVSLVLIMPQFMFVVQRRAAIMMMMRLIQPWHNTSSTPLWYSKSGRLFCSTYTLFKDFDIIELSFADFVIDTNFNLFIFFKLVFRANTLVLLQLLTLVICFPVTWEIL